MKINELRSIIREVIVEEIANESANKKKVAIAEIKRIIAENELSRADVEEGAFGRLIGTEWSKEKAAAELPRYKNVIPKFAKEKGVDEKVIEDALVKIMMKIGGQAALSGANAVVWNAEKKEFTKPGTKLGGPGGNVGG
jgi:hypothetical protein